MLVLSRRIRQVILIGEDIRIEIIDIHNDKVRVGIEAPSGVSVDRLEVRLRREQEGKE